MTPASKRLKNIILFASGAGTNAENIIRHFNSGNVARVVLLVCNKKDAPVIAKAISQGVEVLLVDKEVWFHEEEMLSLLLPFQPDLLVLAGFLWLVPSYLVKAFSNRILNIHPALLPKYGGKGMYGARVHEAVKSAADLETGITIHRVNDKYDEGEIIFQARCPVLPNDTPETIAAKVHALEYAHYPPVIEEVLRGLR